MCSYKYILCIIYMFLKHASSYTDSQELVFPALHVWIYSMYSIQQHKIDSVRAFEEES